MAKSRIQLPVEGSGKKVLTFKSTQSNVGPDGTSVVSEDVEVQGVALVDQNGIPIPAGTTAPASTDAGINVRVISQPAVSTTSSIPTAATATRSDVAASLTSVVLLAVNAARKAAVIVNDGTGTVYLTFGATSSTTAFTMKLGPQATYESGSWIYTGVISGIWDIANGSARVTELT
jgi:hypothetical protein